MASHAKVVRHSGASVSSSRDGGPDGKPSELIIQASESLAERLFAFEQPIGRRIRLAATAQMSKIIGVGGDV